MKHMLKMFLVLSTLVVAQDSTMNVEKEPSLPGWGVYVGGAFGNATSVDDLPDGTNLESRLVLPNIGVSKGLMLGPVPLIVGFGYHHASEQKDESQGGNFKFSLSKTPRERCDMSLHAICCHNDINLLNN